MLHNIYQESELKTNEIGKRIKAARKAAHLSQSELAQRLNKTMRTVQKYESGEIEPSIGMVTSIANILNTSPEKLMGYQDADAEMGSLSDFISVLYRLNKKENIRFEIDVQRTPHSKEWSCSIKFKGNDPMANATNPLCLFLEDFQDMRQKLEASYIDYEVFNQWIKRAQAYSEDVKL